MKAGDKIKIENAKGQIFDAVLAQTKYKKDMSKHYGNKKGEIIMEFVKVYRFIKSRGEFASTATEYLLSAVV